MSPLKENARLRALLGPKGAELPCDECFDQLDRYVELELAGANADAAVPGMRAHLEGCPACYEDRLSLRTFVESGSSGCLPSLSRAPD